MVLMNMTENGVRYSLKQTVEPPRATQTERLCAEKSGYITPSII